MLSFNIKFQRNMCEICCCKVRKCDKEECVQKLSKGSGPPGSYSSFSQELFEVVNQAFKIVDLIHTHPAHWP